MTIPSQLFSEINDCAYLFLREVAEPTQGSLRLLIEEASADPVSTSINVGETQIRDVHPVKISRNNRLFEICWASYIAYSVRNESFASLSEKERAVPGKHCRVFPESEFLDYISRATFATVEYPGPFAHVGIFCENHAVDIVSTQVPNVRNLPPGSFDHLPPLRIGIYQKGPLR
jgi:hypothetical protein